MKLSVPREIAAGETRVALVPETLARLVKAGATIAVESGAGEAAGFPDAAYAAAGARIETDVRALWRDADLVLKVREPVDHPAAGVHELDLAREGSIVVGLLRPAERAELLPRYAARRITAFAMEKVPRTSRAQKMDALSAMSTIAGYKATLLAAARLPRFFPLLMTAAGTIPPARVLVLGAGVAGLSAIATARRLGAVVEAFDVRPAVREEVQSLGASFVGPAAEVASSVGGAGGSGAYAAEQTADDARRRQELLAPHVAQSDVIIATALVPGRAAPRLVTTAMAQAMKPGSVIVDLAAESGGNCELTRAGEDVSAHGVTVLGPVNVTATVPGDASRMYSRTIAAFVLHLIKDGALAPDFTDDIVRDSCIARPGDAS